MGAGASTRKKLMSDKESSFLALRNEEQNPRLLNDTESAIQIQGTPIPVKSSIRQEIIECKENDVEETREVASENEIFLPERELFTKNCDCDSDEDPEELCFPSQSAELLSPAAMSFDMDYQDLLFNLMYFNDGSQGMNNTTLEAVIETANIEAFAAHSEGNTPYKLRPASEKVKLGLSRVLFEPEVHDARECAICKEEMEVKTEVVFLQLCRHCFHSECFLRWINLQSWCPVCRAVISERESESSEVKNENNIARSNRLEDHDRDNFDDFVTTAYSDSKFFPDRKAGISTGIFYDTVNEDDILS